MSDTKPTPQELLESERRQSDYEEKLKERHNKFKNELESLINHYSMESHSNTPDFILAHYLSDCLKAFELATIGRDSWYRKQGSSPNDQY